MGGLSGFGGVCLSRGMVFRSVGGDVGVEEEEAAGVLQEDLLQTPQSMELQTVFLGCIREVGELLLDPEKILNRSWIVSLEILHQERMRGAGRLRKCGFELLQSLSLQSCRAEVL